jgi:hypothetical protein
MTKRATNKAEKVKAIELTVTTGLLINQVAGVTQAALEQEVKVELATQVAKVDTSASTPQLLNTAAVTQAPLRQEN